MKNKQWIALLLLVFGCLAVGSLGSLVTMPSIPTWYAFLKKPPLNPPNWIFAPVWTTLYIMMGVAVWLITLLKKSFRRNKALVFFGIQLILNFGWSYIFFGKQLLLFAFLEVILLWLVILITLIKFYRLKPAAGLLLIPYILWVSFATYLTGAVWYLNK
jgi:tryptophan-rich sensory protein